MKKDDCYIGVVGPDTIPLRASASIMSIERRDGDSAPNFFSATKGYVARQMHFNRFVESDYDSMLLLDHDMIFDSDTLERLRSWDVDYVSGYYMRRRVAPIYSVWYHPFSGEWPFENYLKEPPRNGQLIEIGASGWGCIYIRKDVVLHTRDILRGELDVIEDDMDVWPYDLEKVYSEEEDIVPLRAVKDSIVGSDIRYPFYAKAAGFTLWGDPEVRPSHLLQYELSADDFGGQTMEMGRQLQATAQQEIDENRERIRAAKLRILSGEFDES